MPHCKAVLCHSLWTCAAVSYRKVQVFKTGVIRNKHKLTWPLPKYQCNAHNPIWRWIGPALILETGLLFPCFRCTGTHQSMWLPVGLTLAAILHIWAGHFPSLSPPPPPNCLNSYSLLCYNTEQWVSLHSLFQTGLKSLKKCDNCNRSWWSWTTDLNRFEIGVTQLTILSLPQLPNKILEILIVGGWHLQPLWHLLRFIVDYNSQSFLQAVTVEPSLPLA